MFRFCLNTSLVLTALEALYAQLVGLSHFKFWTESENDKEDNSNDYSDNGQYQDNDQYFTRTNL